MRKTLYLFAPAFVAALLIFTPQPSRAQKEDAAAKPKPAAKVDEKALAVVSRAVEVMGGQSFLGVRTITSKGYYTEFREGISGIPDTFRDYVVLPDRDRTEFRGSKYIQTFAGDAGWAFDGRKRALVDLTPEQMEGIRTTLRTSTDNILRGWWRAEGASLSYVGRREAGLARRNEVVRLNYPDGFEVEFEFDAREGLPAKVLYKKANAEGERVEEEDRYAQFLTIQGARFAFVIDHYRAGQQASRVNYDAVEFNKPVPDSLFAKPADIKTIKF
ncbi:MAG: hypothetical protein JOZ96_10380 [Acidobacteria bacterium]|nr:hypothetical protein [Acidobacteriota bacterium]